MKCKFLIERDKECQDQVDGFLSRKVWSTDHYLITVFAGCEKHLADYKMHASWYDYAEVKKISQEEYLKLKTNPLVKYE